jgi:hypothetical protein
MDKELSSYCINDQGILVYACGTTFIDINNKTVDDFDREYSINKEGRVFTNYQYEVMGVSSWGLIHGKRVAKIFNLEYTLVGRCQRGLENKCE